jgi:hypothetical protein
MHSRRQLLAFGLVVALVAAATPASAAPKTCISGLKDLPENCLVRGSAHKGGIQPDYVIRADDKDLQPLMRYAERLGNNDKLDLWTKVEKIRSKVRRSLPYREYDARPYLRLLANYRRKKEPVPLGKYCKLGVGVCREYAMLTVMALNKAGIKAQFGYAQVKVGPSKGEAIVEDHGFAVIKSGRDKWVVDAYSPYFNGHKLRDLMRKGGPTGRAKLSPNVPEKDRSLGYRQILRINKHPSIRPLRVSAPSAKASGPTRTRRVRAPKRRTATRR